MDTIIEAISEILKFILWYVLWSVVLFNIGRTFLLVATVGNYPRGIKLEKDINLISGVGLGVLFVAWSSLAVYNNWSNIIA